MTHLSSVLLSSGKQLVEDKGGGCAGVAAAKEDTPLSALPCVEEG
jgi:hypothetical protein